MKRYWHSKQNDELTKVGPGTRMGNLFRRYWMPIATVKQLEDHPTAGLAYALASLEVADSPAARRFALETLFHGAAAFILPVKTQTVGFSSDGRWLAAARSDDEIALWDTGQWLRVQSVPAK